jgi:hypothetical protein
MHVDDQVLFIHNPRTSGTAIRRSLLFGEDPNAKPQWPGDLGKHAFANQLRNWTPENEWNKRFKFSIVRNPWDRLVSLYGLFRRPTEPNFEGKIKVKVGKFLEALDHPSLEDPRTIRMRDFARRAVFHLPFIEWVKWCDEYQWQGCRYLGVRPMTRIPQCRWFDALDHVFRFEDREEINDFLQERGYPVPEPENVTDHDPWESYYDDETYDMVAKAFAEDIERFGY